MLATHGHHIAQADAYAEAHAEDEYDMVGQLLNADGDGDAEAEVGDGDGDGGANGEVKQEAGEDGDVEARSEPLSRLTLPAELEGVLVEPELGPHKELQTLLEVWLCLHAVLTEVHPARLAAAKRAKEAGELKTPLQRERYPVALLREDYRREWGKVGRQCSKARWALGPPVGPLPYCGCSWQERGRV